MKHRSLGKMFLLFVVTLGIYRLYWIYKTRQAMVAAGQKIASFWVLFFGSIGIVGTGAVLMIAGAVADSPALDIIGLIVFYIALFAIGPFVAWWFWGYSKAVEAVTKEKLSFPMAMVSLLIVPDGFDMLIIQDGFNKLVRDQGAVCAPASA